jgi:hypothetical protein
VNRCPSCRTLVPASWIACRRCGAALPLVRADAGRGDVGMARAGAIRLARPGAARAAATLDPPAALRILPAEDTLLPGRTGDNLLPRRHADPARRRRVIVAAVVAGALSAGGWTAAHVVFTGSDTAPATPATRDHRTETLLQRAADAARTLFMQEGTYVGLTTAAVESRTRGIRIVTAGTTARAGAVSIRVSGPNTLILATPGAAGTCVFARDDPTKSGIVFAVTRGRPCTAARAPRSGWDT